MRDTNYLEGLEKIGHKFYRYAGDYNIYVKSERAGTRVMDNITTFIENKLKLKVNIDKSAVARPCRRKYLGFSLYMMFGKANAKISEQSIKRYKDKIIIFILLDCLNGLTVLLAIFYYFANDNPYQSELMDITPKISTPVSAGEKQFSLLNGLQKKEMFKTNIKPHKVEYKQRKFFCHMGEF